MKIHHHLRSVGEMHILIHMCKLQYIYCLPLRLSDFVTKIVTTLSSQQKHINSIIHDCKFKSITKYWWNRHCTYRFFFDFKFLLLFAKDNTPITQIYLLLHSELRVHKYKYTAYSSFLRYQNEHG
uniref:Uncharacterized protein n=1 Tax=Onchocerca volvulus TaxID=6282 RepID=A0A8R1TTV3_ONCVO